MFSKMKKLGDQTEKVNRSRREKNITSAKELIPEGLGSKHKESQMKGLDLHIRAWTDSLEESWFI